MTSNEIPPGRGLSLWERIHRDPRYQEGKRSIQARYGLPLDFDIRLEPGKWREWMGTAERSTSEQAERGLAFLREVQALFRKFQVPEAWQDEFIADIAGISTEEISPKTETHPLSTIEEIAEKLDDESETIRQRSIEIEKSNSAGMPAKKPGAVMTWVRSLWEALGKWMRRT